MFRLLILLFSLLSFTANAQPLTSDDVMTGKQTEIEQRLEESHPVTYYLYAQRLFEKNDKNAAVMWFYVGQLRFKFHLLANPNLPADGEPATMGALNETLGRAINEWAGGSPKDWSASIDKALAWDNVHANAFTSKKQHAKDLEELRAGLAGLSQYIIANTDNIRANRAQAGLENR